MTPAPLIKSCLSFGWKTFKARPWLFVGSSLIYAALNFVIGVVLGILPGFLGFIGNFIAGFLISLAFLSFYLKAHDSVAGTSFKDLTNLRDWRRFMYAYVVVGLLVAVGFVLLIIPGIILSIMLLFVPYIVIEKNVGVITAMKESAQITKGHWWKLFFLGLILALMNLIGAMLLLVGLLVTAPISILAMVHAYRTLQASPIGEVASPAPAAPATPDPEPAPAA